MLLLRQETLPEGPGWLYELKLDGYRVVEAGCHLTRPAGKNRSYLLLLCRIRCCPGGILRLFGAVAIAFCRTCITREFGHCRRLG
jgi:hypothetical protein